MRGLSAILLIGFTFATSAAVYDAESVKRAAIDDIIGKYYAFDPFLLPSRKGRFEAYITEEQRAPASVASVRYEEKPPSDSYRPSKVIENHSKESVRYEGTPATQYVVREDPVLPSRHREHRENVYHNEKDVLEEGVPYLHQFRNVQPKRRRRPSHAEPFRPFQAPNAHEFKEGRAGVDPEPLKSEEKHYRRPGSVVRGLVFDEPRVIVKPVGYGKSDARQNAEFYSLFKEKPATKSTRLLERDTSLLTRASWPYGSDASEFYPTLSQYRPKKTRGAARSIRFSDDFTHFTERNSLKTGRDIASKVPPGVNLIVS